MIDSFTKTEMRTCSNCAEAKPLTAFRTRCRKTGARHNICNTCFAAYTRQCRAKQRKKEIGKFNRFVKDRYRGFTAVEKMCEAMLQRFGGLNAFAESWMRALEEARTLCRGSKYVLDAHFALVRLIALSESRQRDREPEFAGMSDEDLDEAIRELADEVLGAVSG